MRGKLNANAHTYTGKENSVTAWTKNNVVFKHLQKKSCNSPRTLGSLQWDQMSGPHEHHVVPVP